MATVIDLKPAPATNKRHPGYFYYYSKREKKEYIILTPSSEDTTKCYKYDIAENKWVHFTSYPKNVTVSCHSAVIDQANGLLYICGGYGQIFATFNFNSNKWTHQSIPEYDNAEITNAHALILPNSELHLFAKPSINSYHLRWDKTQRQFIKASENGICNNCYLATDTFIFVQTKGWLMLLGGYMDSDSDKIWFSKYTGANQKSFVWQEFPLKLPDVEPICTVAYDALVIICYPNEDETTSLWILDCGGEYKWIKPILPQKQYPKFVNSIICTKSNYLHFVSTDNDNNEFHSKVYLKNFIPQYLYNKYVNEDDDTKCNQCDVLKDKLQVVETEKQSLQTLVNDLLNNQSKLENEKNEYKQQIEQYKLSEISLKQKLKLTEEQNSQLNEECKEMQLELNKLKRMKNINTKYYKKWTSDEVVDWLITLEQAKYAKYENKLRTMFNQEQVNGEAIPHIDKTELKNWGIANFMDRTNIYKHFQQLVAQNDNPNINNNYNEGSDATAFI